MGNLRCCQFPVLRNQSLKFFTASVFDACVQHSALQSRILLRPQVRCSSQVYKICRDMRMQTLFCFPSFNMFPSRAYFVGYKIFNMQTDSGILGGAAD